jgi:hypothetical protein
MDQISEGMSISLETPLTRLGRGKNRRGTALTPTPNRESQTAKVVTREIRDARAMQDVVTSNAKNKEICCYK